MFQTLDFSDLLLRLTASSIGGALVGWDREYFRKPAGLRTHMLVAIGSTGFTLVTIQIYAVLGSMGDNIRLDPTKLVEGIVGGIGFLGAGAIIQSRGSVQGITTAASIWIMGAIGLACGVGAYSIAFLLVAFSLITLVALGYIERRIAPDDYQDM